MVGAAKIDSKLTVKQKQFCEEYIADEGLNATKAAIRAGYKVKSTSNAEKVGSKLLRNVRVQAYIQELMRARSKRTEITADKVLEEIAKVAFVNLADFIDDEGRMLPPGNIDRKNMATVQEITEKVYGGDECPIVERRYKLNDKMNALEKLGKHLKLFTDKTEIEHTTKRPLAELLADLANE